MLARHLPLLVTALSLIGLQAQAENQTAASLTGTVSSAKEGPMEGVVVSAKQTGSTITTSVATDDKGRFSFPYGDFSKVHRCAVISLESRAAQNDHDDIAKETKRLLERIDGE